MSPVLGSAAGIAIGSISCLVLDDRSIWCWRTLHGESTGRPARLATDFAATQIAMSRHGLLARSADGTVALFSPSRFGAEDAQAEARVIAERAQRLLPASDGCLIDADGLTDCPLEPAERRQDYRELSAGGVQSLARDELGGCVVRNDGSATCRSDEPPGTWGALGDGLWAPRYRPAEVLGYGRMLSSHTDR